MMLWGYFVSTGPGALVKVNGIMNLTHYLDILVQKLVVSAWRLKLGLRWIFQQNNNPKHTSIYTNKWLTGHKIIIL
jgi:hypothetical protein